MNDRNRPTAAAKDLRHRVLIGRIAAAGAPAMAVSSSSLRETGAGERWVNGQIRTKDAEIERLGRVSDRLQHEVGAVQKASFS